MADLSRHPGVPEPFRAIDAQRFSDMVLAERFSNQRELFAIPVQYAMEVLDVVHGLMGWSVPEGENWLTKTKAQTENVIAWQTLAQPSRSAIYSMDTGE